MVVRSARPGDLDALIEMCAQMHQESAYAFLPFDREKVRKEILTYIENPASQCGLVVEDAQRLVGMLGGYLGEYFFCHEKVASDVVLFVVPEYRGTSAAVRLIRAFQDWAIAAGASEVCLGISTNVNSERTGKFYQSLGFVHVGGVYKLRLLGKESSSRR